MLDLQDIQIETHPALVYLGNHGRGRKHDVVAHVGIARGDRCFSEACAEVNALIEAGVIDESRGLLTLKPTD